MGNKVTFIVRQPDNKVKLMKVYRQNLEQTKYLLQQLGCKITILDSGINEFGRVIVK